jgi:hypothetical protein
MRRDWNEQDKILWDAILAASPNPHKAWKVDVDNFMSNPAHEVVRDINDQLEKAGFHIVRKETTVQPPPRPQINCKMRPVYVTEGATNPPHK